MLGIKRSIFGQKDRISECPLGFVCNFFASQDAHEKNKSAFRSFHEEWSQNRVFALECAYSWNVLFLRNLERVDIGLLQFWEQIYQNHTFVCTLLADTIRALSIAQTTLSTYLGCYVFLLQIWFLKHLVACKSLVITGFFQEDPIWAHLRIESFQKSRRLDFVLKSTIRSVMLEANRLHIGEVICDTDKSLLLPLGFWGVERVFRPKLSVSSDGFKWFKPEWKHW